MRDLKVNQSFKTVITKTGLAKITNAIIYDKKVDFKYMAFGDGGGEYPIINNEMTALVNEKYKGEINNVIELDDNNLKVSKVIPATVGGFYIREIGIFDADDDLIAIGIYPETYKPTIEEGATKDIMASIIITVASTEAIELKIDPNVIVATLKDLEDLRKEIESLSGTEVEVSAIVPTEAKIWIQKMEGDK